MALAAVAAPKRHPWLDEFVQAPVPGFGDLLAGYARVAPYERADAPDAARMLFGGLQADDTARLALGPAIVAWLEQRRREVPPQGRPHQQRWVREICEAFEIVALLDVADAACTLRRRFIIWNEWAGRFVLTAARDARAEYWRMLALTQPAVARMATGQTIPDLSPLWLEICRRSDAELPHRYLSIGLLGLRRLAVAPNGSEAPWIAGLAHWALEHRPSPEEFQAEWLALKPLYPRRDQRWRELVGHLLETKPFQDADIKAPGWWLGDRDFAPMAGENFRLTGDRLRSPGPDACDTLLKSIHEPWQRVAPMVDALLQAERRFLSAAGDPQFFVRTLHRLGTALIGPGGDEPFARARTAQFLAREGLSWQPFDRHLWSLWREALEAGGALEAAELVGWEHVRRDPNDPDARNQLATLLAGPLNRPAEAEILLRETIATFPHDVFARTQLATLLAGPLNRPAAAEILLLETIATFPHDGFARSQLAEQLIAVNRIDDAEAAVAAAFAAEVADGATYALRARLRSHRGETQAAMEAVRDGLRQFPTNAVLRDYQRVLAAGRPLHLEPAARRRVPKAVPSAETSAMPDDPVLDGVTRLGRMRRLRARAEGGDAIERAAALDEVRTILRDDPTFSYAELLATRYGLSMGDLDTMPGFAVAFERALATEDHARLEELARQQPRLQALTLLARALFGDADAAWAVATLLHADPPKDEARPVAFLRARLGPLLAQADRKAVGSIVAANSDSIRRWVHDATEALLA